MDTTRPPAASAGAPTPPEDEDLRLVIEPMRRCGRCIVRVWDESHPDLVFDFWPRGTCMGSLRSSGGPVFAGLECLLWIVRRAAMVHEEARIRSQGASYRLPEDRAVLRSVQMRYRSHFLRRVLVDAPE